MTSALLTSQASAVETLRAAYMNEVERIAEALKPRFLSGELRGWIDDDAERLYADKTWTPPLWRIERFAAEWLGMDFKAEGEAFAEGCRVAYLVRLVSPSEGETEDGQPVIPQAETAAGLDVLDVARRRGWLQPAPESPPPPPPSREELEAMGRRAREDLAAARSEAADVLPETLRLLSAEDTTAAALETIADRATRALGFLQGMAHRVAEARP